MSEGKTYREMAQEAVLVCKYVPTMNCIHVKCKISVLKKDRVVFQAYKAGWKDGREGYYHDGDRDFLKEVSY